jgi:hypothetical protein
MRKIVFAAILIFPFLPLSAQKKKKERAPSDTWWTVNAGTQILQSDVYITAKQPSIGYGSGHTILFRKQKESPSQAWMGVDFMHHYFGVKKVNEFRVFYESWQLTYLVRLSFPANEKILPYLDVSAGGRYLVSFTTDDRSYTGILLRRFGELLKKDGDPLIENDFSIIKEYGKLNLVGAVSGGVLFSERKNKFCGLSLKGTVNFGTKSRFADYRKIADEIDTYEYPLRNGSGLYFTLQLGYSFKL